ncbi:MAG: AAA family ATPase [Myxococcaceae bacterium]
MKKLPDNIADFKTLIANDYIYIDKTKHIYDLLTGSGQNFFLSRPRRFGKTLLVSVLEQIFLGNRELFKGLWIDQSDYAWPKHPVLRLSMAGVDASTPKRFEENLILELHQKAKSAKINLGKANTPASCFKTLILELAEQGKVAVLIDEYDYPILTHLQDLKTASEMRDILKSFYGVLKDLDAQLRFVFLTGVTKFNKTSIFSGINNLRDLTLEKKAASLLGIEPDELKTYFSEHIHNVAIEQNKTDQQIFNELKTWYNGYRFSPDSEKRVYNPCSVLRCLIDGQFRNYWSQTGTPSFLVKLLKENNFPTLELENLTLSEQELGTFEIEQLKLPTLLFQAGYLTIKDYDPESNLYTLSYPNQEVSQSMIEFIAPMMTGQDSFVPWQALAAKLKKALALQDLETFCSLLKPFFADIPYDLHIPLERYYQTVFYMLVKFMGAEIMTEEKTNIGRIDVVFQTPTQVYIVELKMGQSAQKALKQIKERHYAQKYTLLNKPMMAVGLAFDPASKNIVDQAWEVI